MFLNRSLLLTLLLIRFSNFSLISRVGLNLFNISAVECNLFYHSYSLSIGLSFTVVTKCLFRILSKTFGVWDLTKSSLSWSKISINSGLLSFIKGGLSLEKLSRSILTPLRITDVAFYLSAKDLPNPTLPNIEGYRLKGVLFFSIIWSFDFGSTG